VGQFGLVSYIVVVGYLVLIAAIGSSFYKKKSSSKEYFLGGRAMWWLPVGISILAADMSAITVMGSPAWGFRHNFELQVMTLGYPLVAGIVIYVFVPFYAKLNLYTAYEYLERRLDLEVRLVTSLLFQILRGVHVAIVIYAPALVINLVTGLPVWACILLMGLFTTFYTLLGGMRAVIWTSVIQFSTVTLGMGLVFVFSLRHIQGGLAAAYRTALAAGRLRLFNFSTDPTDLTSFWACILGGVVLCLAPLATDQAILQRLFTTKSVKDCNRSIITQAVLVIPLTMLMQLVGTALFVFYSYNPAHLKGLPLDDAVMPFFAVHELSGVLSGLIVASILAASMAVMSAGINALTTATTVDFYKRMFRPIGTPQHYATVGRIGTVCWGLGMTLLALFAGRLGALVLAYTKVSSVISGPMLGIFLLATMTARATPGGTLIGAAVGTLVVAIVGFGTKWSFFYQAPIGLVVTIVAGYMASLLTGPPPAEKVRGLVMWHGEVGEAVSADERA
jgi:SSS family transporter